MKVYLLWNHGYDGSGVIGVFPSFDTALSYAREMDKWHTMPKELHQDISIEYGPLRSWSWHYGSIEEREMLE